MRNRPGRPVTAFVFIVFSKTCKTETVSVTHAACDAAIAAIHEINFKNKLANNAMQRLQILYYLKTKSATKSHNLLSLSTSQQIKIDLKIKISKV